MLFDQILISHGVAQHYIRAAPNTANIMRHTVFVLKTMKGISNQQVGKVSYLFQAVMMVVLHRANTHNQMCGDISNSDCELRRLGIVKQEPSVCTVTCSIGMWAFTEIAEDLTDSGVFVSSQQK